MVHLRQTASFWFNLSRFIRSSWFQVLNILTRRGEVLNKKFYTERLRDPRGPCPYLFIHHFLTEIVICRDRLPYFQSIEMWYLLYIPTNWKSPYRHFLPWGDYQRILILGGSAPRSNPLLNFHTIPFLTRKGPLFLTLSWNMLLYSYPIVVSLSAVFWMSRNVPPTLRCNCVASKKLLRRRIGLSWLNRKISVFINAVCVSFLKQYFLHTLTLGWRSSCQVKRIKTIQP